MPSAAPLVPELQIHLANEVVPLWQDHEAWLGQKNVPPPYWAFVWPGGQAITRYLLDHIGVTKGKRVLDFAAGCGISAIAAAKTAAHVDASEIDPVACAAIAMNATLNHVKVEVLQEDVTDRDATAWNVIVAGDVCYERPMADRVASWIKSQARAGVTVLMGDPGRAYKPADGLAEVARYVVPTSRDLEDRETRETILWRVLG